MRRLFILIGFVCGIISNANAQIAPPADSCSYTDLEVQHQCLFLRAMANDDYDRMRFILDRGYFRINDPVRVTLGTRKFGPHVLSYANTPGVYDWLIESGAEFEHNSLYMLAMKFNFISEFQAQQLADVLIRQAKANRFDLSRDINLPPHQSDVWFPFMSVVARNCTKPAVMVALQAFHKFDRSLSRQLDHRGNDTFSVMGARCPPLENMQCARGMPCLPGERPPL